MSTPVLHGPGTPEPGPEHALLVLTWQPLHAVCSCGFWSMFCAVKGFLTEEEARLEAQEAHDAHLADIQRRARLEDFLKPRAPKGGSNV